MADFNTTYALTNTAEGGYSNRGAADKGGETYQGIARNFNPSWGGWSIIDAYKASHGGSIAQGANPPELANNQQLQSLHKQYAHDYFWIPVHGDDIPQQDLANLMFTIQWGNGNSKVTQQAVNAISPVQVAVDGVIGRDTLSKILALPPNDFYQTLKQKQADYYSSIAYGGNLTGWLARLATFPSQISQAVQQAATDVSQAASNVSQGVSDSYDEVTIVAKKNPAVLIVGTVLILLGIGTFFMYKRQQNIAQ